MWTVNSALPTPENTLQWNEKVPSLFGVTLTRVGAPGLMVALTPRSGASKPCVRSSVVSSRVTVSPFLSSMTRGENSNFLAAIRMTGSAWAPDTLVASNMPKMTANGLVPISAPRTRRSAGSSEIPAARAAAVGGRGRYGDDPLHPHALVKAAKEWLFANLVELELEGGASADLMMELCSRRISRPRAHTGGDRLWWGPGVSRPPRCPVAP